MGDVHRLDRGGSPLARRSGRLPRLLSGTEQRNTQRAYRSTLRALATESAPPGTPFPVAKLDTDAGVERLDAARPAALGAHPRRRERHPPRLLRPRLRRQPRPLHPRLPKSLTNEIVDTTTAHGKLVFGVFALMAEYEAPLIQERTMASLAAARARGRTGGRKPKMTPELPGKAQRMYDAKIFTMAETASCGVTPMTI